MQGTREGQRAAGRINKVSGSLVASSIHLRSLSRWDAPYIQAMASIFQSFPILRQAAPRLSKQFFTCHAPRTALKSSRPSPKGATSSFLRAFRSGGFRKAAVAATEEVQSSSPLSSLGKTIHSFNGVETKARFFPETSDKIVAYWLLGSAASVFGIVVFGGLTRLTESGYGTFNPQSL